MLDTTYPPMGTFSQLSSTIFVHDLWILLVYSGLSFGLLICHGDPQYWLKQKGFSSITYYRSFIPWPVVIDFLACLQLPLSCNFMITKKQEKISGQEDTEREGLETCDLLPLVRLHLQIA